jgi:hypothetical protein
MDEEEINYFCPPGNLNDEYKLRHDAGTYRFLCSVGGHIVFTHHPVGIVLHVVRR